MSITENLMAAKANITHIPSKNYCLGRLITIWKGPFIISQIICAVVSDYQEFKVTKIPLSISQLLEYVTPDVIFLMNT